jgi:two-component system CitB family sensor kinase
MAELPSHIPREQLVSILGNLIDNALEATLLQQGSGGKVMISMTDLGNDLIFEIEDQGVGITKGQQQQIFEKGFTSKAEAGHGIGLHLVKGLLKSLSGTITLEQGDEKGSRFIIYIPKNKNTV